MTRSEVAQMIADIKVPYAYYQFPQGTAQATPFICFFYPQSGDFVADNENYSKIDTLIIELYTDSKDFTMEDKVEAALNSNNLVFIRDSSYLDEERMWMTTYQTEVLITPDVTITTEGYTNG